VESNEIDAGGNKILLSSSGPQEAVAVPAELNTPTQTNNSQSSPTQTQSATL
jgi:hypothetical protein